FDFGRSACRIVLRHSADYLARDRRARLKRPPPGGAAKGRERLFGVLCNAGHRSPFAGRAYTRPRRGPPSLAKADGSLPVGGATQPLFSALANLAGWIISYIK